MADLSRLSNLNPTEPLTLDDTYQDATGFELPPAGEYIVRAPETFPTEAFGVSNSGALTVQIDPTILGPTGEGFTIRYARVSAKQFDRKGTKASQLGDYLRACGVTGTFNTPQDQANAVEQTASKPYRVELDWRVYKKMSDGSEFKVDGMRNFPTNGNGGYLPFVVHPTEKDEKGNPLRLRANLQIKRYIAATQ